MTYTIITDHDHLILYFQFKLGIPKMGLVIRLRATCRKFKIEAMDQYIYIQL